MKKILILTLAIGMVCALTGCKSDSDPKCDCPNGTVHLVGETCCNYDDCVCEKGFVSGKRVQGIAVTNREGLSDTDFDKAVKAVEEALDMFKSPEYEQFAYMLPIIKKHIAEIRVLPAPPQMNAPSVIQENGRYALKVEEGLSADDIANTLYEWVLANPQLK